LLAPAHLERRGQARLPEERPLRGADVDLPLQVLWSEKLDASIALPVDLFKVELHDGLFGAVRSISDNFDGYSERRSFDKTRLIERF
jgi:hypothetical protein